MTATIVNGARIIVIKYADNDFCFGFECMEIDWQLSKTDK